MERLNAEKAASLAIAVYVIIAFVFPFSAFAADFAHRLNSEKRSEKEGLGRNEVPLLNAYQALVKRRWLINL